MLQRKTNSDARKDESDRGLDLSRRDGRSVVVRSKLGSLSGNSLEDVRDKRVEDSHGLVTIIPVSKCKVKRVVKVTRTKYQCRGGPA